MLVVCGIVGTILAVASSQATATPDGFEISTELSGLRRPTSFQFSPDGRVFVAEHRGVVQVFDSLADPTATEVVDLRDQVHAVDGRGLLAIELDPNFPTDPYLYVLYTYDGVIGGPPSLYSVPGGNEDECPSPPGPGRCVAAGRLSRLTLDGDVAVSETVLVEDWCQTVIHSVGDLAWDPSGALFASHGDGAFGGQPDYGQRAENPCGDSPGPAGVPLSLPDAEGGAMRAQDYQTSNDPLGLNGSIIRVDPATGDGWHDNANALSGNINERRLIGHGFRNPFRLEVRPGTNEVWAGDVGWNTYEELNVIGDPSAPVQNFGWPCYEGPERAYDLGLTLCSNLYDDPTSVTPAYFSYRQGESLAPADTCKNTSGAITGLQFYEGGAYPTEFDGALFMADSSRECVWVVKAGADGRPLPGTTETLQEGENIVDIELGPGGDVYLLSLLGDGDGGKIFRVAYPDGDVRPTARLIADVTTGPTALEVAFSAGLSSPAEVGDTLSFDWDLDGDGAFDDATGSNLVGYTYVTEGRYVVQVRVTDQRGEFDTAAVVITAGTPPAVTITQPTGTDSWQVGDNLVYQGSATDGGQPLPAEALAWDLVLHHCDELDDCHIHILGSAAGVTSGAFEAPEHEYPSFLEVVLTATDPAGLSSTASVEVLPQTTQLTADTVPAGLDTIVNGERGTAPVTQEVIVGSQNTLTAPLGLVDTDGERFEFLQWNDFGAATHDVVVGSDPVTFTAEYETSEMPSVSVSDAYVAEVNKGVASADFRVTLSYPSNKRVTVRVDTTDGTATRGDYFQIGSPKSVVFRPGQTSKVFSVRVKNDPADESTETFFLDVVSATNAGVDDGRGIAYLADNDPIPRFNIADATTKENDRAETIYKLRLNISTESQQPARATMSVVGGTAVPGVDYEPFAPMIVEWNGTRRVDVPITIFGNNVPNDERTIVFQLTDAQDLDIVDDIVELRILDDEPGVSARDVWITEGAAGVRKVNVQMRLSPTANVPVTVDVQTVDGTAVAGEDYAPVSTTITLAPRKRTANVTIDVFGDNDSELTEAFELVMTNATNASIRDDRATVEIRSDDYIPDITISDASAAEGGKARFTVSLSGPASQTVSVRYSTVDGTAVANGDYPRRINRFVTILKGRTERTFVIPAKNDALVEGDETFEVVLSSPVNGVIIDGSAIGTIIDTD